MIEEPAFAFESAAVAVEGAVACDDTVAWDHDAHTIQTIGQSDGSGPAGVVEAGRQLSVGECLAVGDLDEGVPDFALPF